MAWYQGYTTVANLIQTLSDMLVGGGWELVEMKNPDDRIFKTTTDPEGAIREPVNLQASLTGEPAGGTGLTGDTTYYYAVTAVGPRGESVASAEVSVAQPTTPERVRLSWRRVDGAMHYHVYRRASTGTLERIGTTDGQCEHFVDDGFAAQPGIAPPAGKSLTMYARIRRDSNKLKEITVTIGEDYDQTTGNLINPSPDVPVVYWRSTTAQVDTEKQVVYYGSITRNRIALVMYGDPALDFDGYLVAFLYLGRLVPFPESFEDIDGNFVLMGSADISYSSDPQTYGERTSNGIDTVMVFKTRSGLRYQQHELAFVTQRPQMTLEDKGFNPSAWTEKYHLSPIYVVHGYEGYRGMLEDVLGVQAHNVVHLDEFLITYPDGGEDRYKFFNLNPSGRNPIKNASPNSGYSIAIRKI